MQPEHLEIVVAADNEELRNRIARILQSAGIVPAVVGKSSEAYHLSPEQLANGFIILETNDDVARMVQTVNDMHHSPYHAGGCVPVMCVVSKAALRHGQSLGFWLINGMAAVGFVWTPDLLHDLPGVIRRLSRPGTTPPPPRPEFDQHVQELSRNSMNPEAYLHLATRLADRDRMLVAQLYLAAALIRHAIALEPTSAEAHSQLAHVLVRLGENDAAVEAAREAIRLKPDLAEAHLHLGSALVDKHKGAARAALRTAIALDGEGQVARWARNIMACRCL